jgi:hypothetical protein
MTDYENSGNEPPVVDFQTGLPGDLSQIATVRDEPTSYLYQPPEGAVLTEPPAEGVYYHADPPNPQTDRLQAYERRYIIPLALSVSPVFGAPPITDDIYRKIPDFFREKNLFCIISRSGIVRTDDGLRWESVVVSVRKFCVVRVQTLLNPQMDRFAVKKAFLWSSRNQRYEIVEDPETGIVSIGALTYILERYNQIEGVVRR